VIGSEKNYVSLPFKELRKRGLYQKRGEMVRRGRKMTFAVFKLGNITIAKSRNL
jgi:hypothetical protein